MENSVSFEMYRFAKSPPERTALSPPGDSVTVFTLPSDLTGSQQLGAGLSQISW